MIKMDNKNIKNDGVIKINKNFLNNFKMLYNYSDKIENAELQNAIKDKIIEILISVNIPAIEIFKE